MPADPRQIATRQDFARELSAVRERAGLTVRDIAKIVRLPPATVGGYFAGRHLPAARPPDLLRTILSACGVRDEETLAAWDEALTRVRTTPGRRPASAPVPYRGLASFGPGDAEWFHGREELTARLLGELTARRADGGIVSVVGPSGSGKSSLIQAGAVAGLPADWPVVSLTPGSHPLRDLEAALATGPRLVVVDQLEELFTLCPDEEERSSFVDLLCGVPPGLVLLGLRADFYGHALRLPRLAAALQDCQVVVGPMSAGEVTRAIVEPARRARLDVEDGLVAVLLRDFTPGPANLPLLSHALRATWQRSRQGRLTVGDYQLTGGVHDAVAHTAEACYDALDPERRRVARDMFLRLVQVSPSAAETRRRISRSELPPDPDTEAVVQAFIEARLLTADTGELEITHEVLLSAWPRLRGWIDEGRADLRYHRRITEAAQSWLESGRDPHLLYRAERLAAAGVWLADNAGRVRLNQLEQEFLAAGQAFEQAEQRAARRRTRRFRQFTAVLGVLLIATATLAVVARRQWGIATEERDNAVSRQIAIEAEQLRETDPALAMQLSLAAYRTATTTEARSSLLSTFAAPPMTRLLGTAGVMQAVAVTPDGGTVATAAADHTIHLWTVDPSGRAARRGPVLAGHTETIFALAFSPDGRTLASGGGDRVVRLWDLSAPDPIALPAAENTVYTLAFSPDGRTLAAGSADNMVRLWALAGRTVSATVAAGGYVHSVAFSSDGRMLAAGSADRTVRVWDVADPARPRPVGAPLTGPEKTVFAVAFSPDGKTLAAGSADRTVRRWRIGKSITPLGEPLTGATGWINGIAFDPDGRNLAAASSDGKVRIWDSAGGLLVSSLPHPGAVTGLGYARSTGVLVTSAADGTARLWQPPGPVLGGAGEGVFNAIFARTGPTLAVASSDSTVRLWDAADARRPRPLGPAITDAAAGPRGSGAATLSPDGRTLAVGAVDGSVQLWDVRDPAAPVAVAPRLHRQSAVIQALSFSPDGRVLAATSDDRTGALWDVTDPHRPAPLGDPITGPANYAYSPTFSPDGRIFAMSSADNLIRLWDIADPRRPVPLGRPLSGPAGYVFSLAFSPDGRTLAAGSADSTVRLWDITAPDRPQPIGAPLTGPDNYVNSVAFSSDGALLAAGGGDGTIWVWTVRDPARPRHYATLDGHTSSVFTVEFDSGRPVLASGGTDRTARLWLVDPDEAGRQICATTGDPITEAEWHKYVPDRPYRRPC